MAGEQKAEGRLDGSKAEATSTWKPQRRVRLEGEGR